MMTEAFLSQFWPEFWGSVLATLFVAFFTFIFAYIARLHIARFFRRTARSIRHTIAAEEEKLKDEFVAKK